MDDKRLRRRCEAKLRELDIPDPFDVRSFCKQLGRQRGRPIVLRPLAGAAGAVGGWVSMPSADLIFYEQNTSVLHQEHIILHEVSHLLCAHAPLPVTDGEISQLLFPDFDPEIIRLVLPRRVYSTLEEREAEILATLILERTVGGPPRRPPAVMDAETEGVLHRLEASLERKGST